MAAPHHTAVVLGALGDFLLTLPLLCELRRRGPVQLFSRGAYRALLPACLAEAPFVDTDGAAGGLLFAESAVLPEALGRWLAGATVHGFMRGDERLAQTLRQAGVAGIVWHDPRPTAPPHIALRFFAAAGLRPPAGMLDG